MMQSPLISIIVPAYNSAVWIGETLTSVLNQTYSNWECFIIDDGSLDNTEEIIEKWLQLDNRFCYHKIVNGGASNARNVGMAMATGDYVQFLDADDLLHPEKLERQIKFMQEKGLQISFTQWANFVEDIDLPLFFKFARINFKKFKKGLDILFSFGMENWFIPSMAWLTRKELLDQAGAWNTEITNNDDGEYFARVLFYAEKISGIEQVLAYYRHTPNDSLSKLNSTQKIDSAFKSYKIIENFLKKERKFELLTYPKRLYYVQYSLIRNQYPLLAKRAANEFDKIKNDCFLSKRKKYWRLVNSIGLYKGDRLFRKLEQLYLFIR